VLHVTRLVGSIDIDIPAVPLQFIWIRYSSSGFMVFETTRRAEAPVAEFKNVCMEQLVGHGHPEGFSQEFNRTDCR
jgi:hypothetical protein